ncbi:MAG: sn-glycerol-3-phosphate ABC transporter ATP-binding protein UgpC [Vampirovibrionales bacterium]|nr:sn-glycerol-3-phosphate ABC transporter ATP-binding protein UgpC [Vampirovibrionales bacterium]
MAEVVLSNIRKSFDKTPVINHINLTIADREFVVLVGPSGCGKSTVLRMIAGLETISEGEIEISGKRMNDVAPKDRDIAMVFQNYALYPHMSVYENMAFGLKMRKVPKAEIESKVKNAAEILDLAHLLNRKPKQLSGGQRQRVALGRAIVRNPKVFLMDEPLSNLDAKLRVQMRLEITKLHRELSATTIYVTHDQVEAMTMGDRIVVLNKGDIQQVDKPLNVYQRPANLFVAGFIGQMNLLKGTAGESAILCSQGHLFQLPESFHPKLRQHVGKAVIIGIRPEYFSASQDNADALAWQVQPEQIELLGSSKMLHFHYAEAPMIAQLPADYDVSVEKPVTLWVNPDAISLFDADTEDRIN